MDSFGILANRSSAFQAKLWPYSASTSQRSTPSDSLSIRARASGPTFVRHGLRERADLDRHEGTGAIGDSLRRFIDARRTLLASGGWPQLPAIRASMTLRSPETLVAKRRRTHRQPAGWKNFAGA
ncbi:hypothetical protein ACP4J4_06780 [Aureimonas ureilytica]|uniref:hypothetical protein n=1 Tax=Aureimonas ureilytica TaxID=401562 RepID=UPI003CF05D3F